MASTTNTTKVGLRIKRRIERLLANPIEAGVRQAPAVRSEVGTLAKAKRKKARSPAQIAAFKKMRAGLKAKYGTTDITKIRGRKKGRKRSTRREEEEEMLLENAAKKKSRKKRGKKRKAKAKSTKRKTKRKVAKATRKPKRKAAAPKKRRKAKARKAAAPKAARKTRKKSRRKSKAKHTVAGKVHVVKLPGRTIVKEIRVEAAKKRKKRSKKRASGGGMTAYGPRGPLLENPMGEGLGGYEALFENPMGPYSTSSLKGFGWAAGGVGLGLVIAELVDRYVATRTPSDSKGGAKGNNPWYGRDAAAAMQRRPDALRLGVQAVGALAGIGGAYALRGRSIAPWLIGGTAVGFGANLFKTLIMWWVAPRVLKSKPNEALLGNRLLPLEQVELQDSIDAVWEDWQQIASLAAAQAVAGTPVAVSPLNAPGSADLLTLGGATGNGPLPGAVGFVAQPGRVGACMSCGGMGGCWSNCPQVCGNKCPEGSGIPRDGGGGDGGGQRGRLCEYVVQAGDNLSALVDASGVPVNDIAALNGGGLPDTWWKAGATVILPEQACYAIWRRQGGGGGEDGGGGQPLIPEQPPGGGQPLIPQQPPGGGQPLIPQQPPGGGGGGLGPLRPLPARPVRPQQVYRHQQPTIPAVPYIGGAETDDVVQRQAALRNVGGEETEEE